MNELCICVYYFVSWSYPVMTMVTRCHINGLGAYIITSAERRRLCFLLCWLVCLLATLWGNAWRDFYEIFRLGRARSKEQSEKKMGVLCLTPSIEERRYIEVYSSMIQFFIFFFSRKSVLVSNITGKRMNGFSWNFQERLHIRQRKIWNIFGSWWLTPWIQDRFFYFVNP